MKFWGQILLAGRSWISLYLPQVLGSSELGDPDWVPAGNTAATKVEQVPALTELSQSWGDVKETNTVLGSDTYRMRGLG